MWICINMHKINLFISSFFKYSQFLSLATRLATAIFDTVYPKNFQSPVNLREFVPACKSVNSISSLARTILDHDQQKTFQPTFNFCRLLITCKKRDCFIDVYWRNKWFKNPAIWFFESILAQQVQLQKTKFKSKRYTVQCWCNKKLLH